MKIYALLSYCKLKKNNNMSILHIIQSNLLTINYGIDFEI